MVDIDKVKDIKVIYYVDTDDNIKTTLCAVPSDKDIRSKEVIEFIRCEIYGALSPILHISISDCEELAKSIVHHGIADVFEYEFGVEEIHLFEC